jgi:hypothetical protein
MNALCLDIPCLWYENAVRVGFPVGRKSLIFAPVKRTKNIKSYEKNELNANANVLLTKE